jgi:hypothetical protein
MFDLQGSGNICYSVSESKLRPCLHMRVLRTQCSTCALDSDHDVAVVQHHRWYMHGQLDLALPSALQQRRYYRCGRAQNLRSHP